MSEIAFNYPGRAMIFKDFNLEILAGQTLGVVGQTGSGKTTLIKLLLRLYDPQNGQIFVGEQNLSDITLNSLRKNIGFVNQEVHLFDGTIKENISK